MDDKEIHLNQSELYQYSRALANRLADYYFIDHNVIGGKDILNFCDIKQVNLFLVKNLFEKWQGETSKLDSPYFDFNHTAVKQALQQFMNVLSQHIQIKREDFNPILIEAIRETLLLVVEPLSFFKHEINKVIYQPPSPQKYKEITKYITINKKIWVAFLDKLNQQTNFDREYVQQVLEATCEEKRTSIEPMQWVLQNFSDIFHLDVAKLLGQEETITSATNLASEKTIIMEDAPTMIPHEIKNEKPIPAPQKPKFIQDAIKEEEDYGGTLNQTFRNQSPKASLAERFQNAKVHNLRAAMSLNQKFQFIDKLFGGDSLAFNDALDKLEESQSYEEVKHLFQNEYGHRYAWDFNQEETKSFMELVGRKFS